MVTVHDTCRHGYSQRSNKYFHLQGDLKRMPGFQKK